MTDSGTKTENNALSNPKTEEEYFDMVNAAVSEGNTEEVDRLMTLEWTPTPDATDDKTEEQKAADESKSEDEDEEAAKKLEVEAAGDPKKEIQAVSQTTEVAPEPQSRVPKQEVTPPTAEEKLARMEQELQRLRSDAGRVASLQSRLAQLEQQQRLQKVVQETTKPPEETESEKKIKQRIAQLREVDPDTADLLEAMRQEHRDALEQRVKGTAETLTTTITEQQEEQRLQQEFEKVITVHPEFDQIRRHVYWHKWKDSLTPDQRAWAESDDSAKVIEAVGAFKAQMAAYQQPPVQQAQPVVQAVQPASTETVVDDPAKRAREQRLIASTSSKDTTIKPSGVADTDKMFSDFYNKTLRESGIK